MTLRHYQQDLIDGINKAHAQGHKAVMVQSATGSGKTVTMGAHATQHMRSPWRADLPGGISIAHRSTLVGQLSLQLAREGVPHGIIASQAVIRGIVAQHVEEFGRSYYNERSHWKVASVDTLNKRDLGGWGKTVGVVHIDEAHHVLRDNKWGKAAALFPNARLVLPTATPIRADGRGLGSDSDGLADVLIEAPSMRWFIDNGYLTDYKVYTIKPSDLELDGVKVSTNGDFNPEQLREAVHASKAIVGDVVSTYLKYAAGKLGVTFAVDVPHAHEIAEAFKLAGVPAEVITGTDDESTRNAVMRRFKAKQTLQIVSVDILGEGVDIPTISCVSFARPTASFSLYTQQWGRGLRLNVDKSYMAAWDDFTSAQRKAIIAASEKPHCFIFDHVGAFYLHEGPPDRPRVWSLEARKRGSNSGGGIPMRVCLAETCAMPYERIYPACPFCGTEAPPPSDRSGANTVDGDIALIDPALLAQYLKEVERIDAAPVVPYGVPRVAVVANHMRRQAAQHRLRELMAYWAGTYPGDADRVLYRRFWFAFGIDVLAAKALNEKDAEALMQKIFSDIASRGIVLPVTNNEVEYA
jgi:DNA repair protein RadD